MPHALRYGRERYPGYRRAPGAVADFDNRLLVRPREDDSDDEITDALRLVFEKDPSLDANQIRAETHAGVVLLEGLVHSDEQRKHAELDAWCIVRA